MVQQTLILQGLNPRIYLDHAATSPLHEEAWLAMDEARKAGWGNPSSIHADGRLARTLVEESRRTVARYLNASLSEIFFTSCGTESINMVLTGCVRDLGIRKIFTSPVEHHCVLHTLEHLSAMHGVQVEYLPLNSYGTVNPGALEHALQASGPAPCLVALMHVNNETGAMHDLEAIGQVCKENEVLFLCDTVQSIGFQAIDLAKLPVDFIAGSGHKFYGPKGSGFVFIRSGIAIKPLLHGGSQERNMRAGTENVLGICGLARAIALAESEGASRLERMSLLREDLRQRLLESIPGVSFNGESPGLQSPKVLSVNIPPNPRAEMLLMHLDIEGISASGGSACSSGVESASHVLSHLDIPDGYRTVRFSFSPWNTLEETRRVGEVMAKLCTTE